MKRIEITIQGTTPLLCNRFTDAEAEKATSQTSGAITGDKGTPQEQADTKLYRDLDGKLCIPQPNAFRCLIDAGKFFKAGKSKVTTQKSSIIPACVDMEGVMFPIIHKDKWTVDKRPIRNPATGGRRLAYRPCFNDWKLSFVVNLDETMIGLKLFRDIVDKAGRAIGLGDFRPDCKGPFGKFVVVKWNAKGNGKS